MRIGTDLKGQLAHLFQVLVAGERLAQECAQRQALLAPERKTRSFLLTQAQQEGLHAWVFQRAASALAPRGSVGDSPALRAMFHYRERLFADLDRGNLAGSLVGMQVVLEGVGARVLKEMDAELRRRGDRHAALRRRLLLQEDAHHAFGLRCIQRLCAETPAASALLATAGREYTALSIDMLTACEELFLYLGAEPQLYQPALPACLGGNAG
jgi:1,2-phenylacetyl-CoA epoxidase catalytic subunit